MFCKNYSFAVPLSKFLSLLRTEEGNELSTCDRMKIIVASQFGFWSSAFLFVFSAICEVLGEVSQTKTASEGTQRAWHHLLSNLRSIWLFWVLFLKCFALAITVISAFLNKWESYAEELSFAKVDYRFFNIFDVGKQALTWHDSSLLQAMTLKTRVIISLLLLLILFLIGSNRLFIKVIFLKEACL